MNKQILDLTGHKYGRLSVVKYYDTTKSVRWECLCDCGKTIIIQANNLRSGHTRSCGCFQKETSGKHTLTHGHTVNHKATSTYAVWSSMKARCNNPRSEYFHHYGGRGITVCASWGSFINFLKDMGDAPAGMEIDRINNDLGYFKENCRWTTKTINRRNRRYVFKIEYQGEEIDLMTLSEKTNIPFHSLRLRIREWGLTLEQTLISCKNLRKKGVNKRREKKYGKDAKIPS